MWTKADVKEVVDYDDEQFSFWLLNGLEGVLINKLNFKDKNPPFLPLQCLIGHSDNIILDLESIANALPVYSKNAFKKSIKLAIEQVKLTKICIPILRHLYKLAVLFKVDGAAESIAIQTKLYSENFSITNPKEADDVTNLYLDAVICASDLTNASSTTRASAISSLIHSRFFPPMISDIAFFALCRADPINVDVHFNNLSSFFIRLFRDVLIEKSQQIGFAKTMADAIGIDILSKKLCNIDPYINMWLFEALFNYYNSHLMYIRSPYNSNVYMIAFAENVQGDGTVNGSSPDIYLPLNENYQPSNLHMYLNLNYLGQEQRLARKPVSKINGKKPSNHGGAVLSLLEGYV